MMCRRAGFRLLFLFALVTALASSVAQVGIVAADGDVAAFGLNPTSFDPAIPETKSYFVFNTQPTAVIQSEVKVTNAGKAAGTVRLYPVDGTTSDATGTVFPAETDPRQDVGGWIVIATEDQELTLGPNESKVIPFTITVPKTPRPGQHVGGFVAENKNLTAGDVTGGVSVSVRSRTILAVQVNLPGPIVEQLSATGVSAAGTQGNQTLVLDLKNEGTNFVKPVGTLRVTDASGQMVQDLALKMDTFLPQTAIKYPTRVQDKALDAGDYEATLDLTFGEKGTLHYTTRFSISPAQIAQIFPPSQSPQATLVPPRSVQVPAPGNPPATSPVGSAATGGTAAKSGPSWLLVAGAVGMGLLLTMIAVGAFAAGRRRRP